MFQAFGGGSIAPIFYHYSEPACIAKAVADLQSDLGKLSGQMADSKPYLPRDEDGYIVVGSLGNAAFRDWLEQRRITVAAIQGRWEHFLLRTFGDRDQNLLICGSDERGALFGIYTFCESYLGVDPLYFWTDNEPQRRPELSIAPFTLVDGPKTFRYRGIFVNDEDLLTEWLDGGGKRYTTYPFYHQVVQPSIIEKVAETALRLKMNLIIPASLVDIDNPAEENLVRLVSQRGLFVSQHHVEPLGVSHFAWDNYWQKRGMQVSPSFVSNPDHFAEIWRYYAARWAKYPNVIWQLGLRGRGDRPVWWSDANVPASDAERGALISSAYARQYEILKDVLGHEDFVSTATLWVEGSDLQKAGVLAFPERTILVFADHGPTQMMRDDYFQTERKPGRQFGLYHHVAFWSDGPHLADGTSLQKLCANYANAAARGDTAYSILNVCNLREFVIGLEAMARMNWDFASFVPEAFLQRWIGRTCGPAAAGPVAEVYRRHMDAYVTLGSDRFPGELLLIDGITRILGNALLDGLAGTFRPPDYRHGSFRESFTSAQDMADFLLTVLPPALARWQGVISAAYDALPSVEPGRREYFVDHFMVQAEIMLGLYGWCHALALATRDNEAGNRAGVRQRLGEALFCMQKLLLDRRKAEHDEWQNWYRGDKKMNLPAIVTRMKEMLTSFDKERAQP